MLLITGSRGVVGTPLCQYLQQQSRPFIEVSRFAPNAVIWDLTQALEPRIKQALPSGITALIHCAPIWLLPQHIGSLHDIGVRRIVVFSSTSVIGKQNSDSVYEQQLVTDLEKAEHSVIKACEERAINLTILRPTLIYGYGRDQNVSRLANFIRRYRCMLLVGKASGLRQPVHADDLVQAALSVLNNPTTYQKQYNLGGGERLTYRSMVKRIFSGLGQRVFIISIPLWLFRFILNTAAKVSRFNYTPDMANRMSMDLVYDQSAAEQDFAYAPQTFLEQPKRDLRRKA